MKNHFFISVSNGLLEDKHQKRMGSSIWQFLWCLDKVTIINREGIGIVLGGKPIQLKEMIGGHRVTISRNLTHLEKEGYVKLIHTPRGIIIHVMKMKKRFNKNVNPLGNKNAKPQEERISENAKPALTKVLNQRNKNAKPVYENAKPNKTISVDNTVDSISETGELPAATTPSDEARDFFSKGKNYQKTVNWLKSKGIDESLIILELGKFISYWIEKNSTGRKERWQMEKTFEVRRRLATWLSRVKQFTSTGLKKFEATPTDKFSTK